MVAEICEKDTFVEFTGGRLRGHGNSEVSTGLPEGMRLAAPSSEINDMEGQITGDVGHPATDMTTTLSVLIADDQIVIRALHAHLVRRIIPGVKVLFAEDGRKALELAAEMKPDFIISDYAMPEISGGELARRLSVDPETRSIPFLLVTALESVENLDLPSVVGVVRKPIKPADLEELLRKHLTF